MILLIPVLTLFMGSVTIASVCTKCVEVKCTRAAVHQGCGHGCLKGQSGKGERKGKDSGGCCVDCPLCCLVTFKPFYRWEIARQVTIIDYTVISDNNLSDYFQQHWKPPNGSFLS
jgi:hypothetical protein